MRLFISVALVLSFCLVSFAQEQQPAKKKPLSMDMNDVKAAPKEDKPKEATTDKEQPKTTNTSPTPSAQSPATPTAPVDLDASLPPWAKVHKQLLVGYLESQLNGEDPAPYFYFGDSVLSITAGSSRPVNLRGSYGYKVLDFEGDADTSLWKISIQAPAGRSSTAGIWFATIKLAAGGDSFRIYSMTRNNPYQK